MGYKKIGLAFCRGLRKEARIVADLLMAQGFDVVSVICKTGGFPKESVGIPKEKKVNADAFEPMCNPIAQAEFLNSQETEFNIALGLCVGHDSMFYKYSKADGNNAGGKGPGTGTQSVRCYLLCRRIL